MNPADRRGDVVLFYITYNYFRNPLNLSRKERSHQIHTSLFLTKRKMDGCYETPKIHIAAGLDS